MKVSDQIAKLVQAEPGVYSQAELSRRFEVTRERIRQIVNRDGLCQFTRERRRHYKRRAKPPKIGIHPVTPEQQPEVIEIHSVTPEQQPETVEIHSAPIHTTRIMICPRCKGPLTLDRDYYGWYEDCIFCGYNNDLYTDDEQGEHLAIVTSGGLV